MGKRDEGGIGRRKDGRWKARYTVQTATGPKRRSAYGKTEAEAIAKCDRTLSEGDAGPAFDAGDMTVGIYLAGIFGIPRTADGL